MNFDPPSPLTSLPDDLPSSSPWPSPTRNSIQSERRSCLNDPQNLEGNLKYYQSAWWHLSEASCQSTGYRGTGELDPNRVVLPKDATPEFCLESLQKAGYRLHKYENDCRTALLLDKAGTCVGVFVPPHENTVEIENIGRHLRSLKPFATGRAGGNRGSFKVVRWGLQMGGGSKNLSPCSAMTQSSPVARKSIRRFFRNRAVRQHFARADASFRRYFPSLHHYYRQTLEMGSAFVYDTALPVEQFPFAMFTLNVDDQCVCDAHLDSQNLSGGLCLASPFGTFDHTKGGHLVLHNLKMILEVPPGSIVLFPSAIITHENIPISHAELRQSITAYSPGSLFQWADRGFQTATNLAAKNSPRGRPLRQQSRKKVQSTTSTVWPAIIKYLPHVLAHLL